MSLLREFKPALTFLAKFLAFYFAGNILYGLFIESYYPTADPVTRMVTEQSVKTLRAIDYAAESFDHNTQPKIGINNNGKLVLYVFEGCNGLNVIIVFAAFLFAFGGPVKSMAVFFPVGILIIHLVNLLRIDLLFHMALNNQRQFYYFHKYFFTATLYVVVFALWALWVIRFHKQADEKKA